MHQKSRVAVVIAALAALLVPVTASAAVKTTAAGPPLMKPPPGVPEYSDADQFFPATTAIHVGDSVQWKLFGFHTIYFPKKGGKNAAFIKVDPTRRYSDKDPTGNPFFFTGRPQLTVDPATAFPFGGKSYNGTKVTASGIPQDPRKFRYKLAFTKAGTYTYFCTIHPNMKGTIKVLPRSVPVPSAAADKKAVARQIAGAVAELKRNNKRAAAPGNVVEVGRDTHKNSLLNFFPMKKTVPVGTSVTFRMSSKTNENHTVTFGSDVVLAKNGYASKVSKRNFSPLPGTGKNGPPVIGLAGAAFFPSDQGPLSFDGTQHGGFVNTGFLGEKPLPTQSRVTFTARGTYNYVCLIHDGMHGQIVVQ